MAQNQRGACATLADFHSDLRKKYPQIRPWAIFHVGLDGLPSWVPSSSYCTPVTDDHIAFGGSESIDAAELETLAVNNCGVLCVQAKHFYGKASAQKNPLDESREIAEAAQSRACNIADRESYIAAGEVLKDLKRMQRAIEEHFAPMAQSALETHRKICAQRAKHLEPLKRGEQALKEAMVVFKKEEERRLAEAHRRERADFEAHKKEVAETLLAEGKVGEALAVKEATIADPAETAPKADGVYTRTTYIAEVYDLPALIRAAAEHVYLEDYLMPNQKELDATARAHKGGESGIPGVRFVAKETVGVRA